MAGSKRWYKYTTDAGAEFAYEQDKSNTEATHVAVPEWTTDDNPAGIPRNIRPRFVRYTSSDGLRTIRVVVLNLAAQQQLPTTIPDPIGTGGGASGVLNRSTGEGEKFRRYPRPSDTGQTNP